MFWYDTFGVCTHELCNVFVLPGFPVLEGEASAWLPESPCLLPIIPTILRACESMSVCVVYRSVHRGSPISFVPPGCAVIKVVEGVTELMSETVDRRCSTGVEGGAGMRNEGEFRSGELNCPLGSFVGAARIVFTSRL